MYAKIISGKELNTPSTEISGSSIAAVNLSEKSYLPGPSFAVSKNEQTTIDRTTKQLIPKLNKLVKRREFNYLGREIGKRQMKVKILAHTICPSDVLPIQCASFFPSLHSGSNPFLKSGRLFKPIISSIVYGIIFLKSTTYEIQKPTFAHTLQKLVNYKPFSP